MWAFDCKIIIYIYLAYKNLYTQYLYYTWHIKIYIPSAREHMVCKSKVSIKYLVRLV